MGAACIRHRRSSVLVGDKTEQLHRLSESDAFVSHLKAH